MTDRQREVLARAGLPTERLDRGQASELIDALVGRRAKGLCTVKQARLLARHGLHPDVPFEVARQWIDRIAGARWRASDELVAESARFEGAVADAGAVSMAGSRP